MNVPIWIWIAVVLGFLALMAVDLFIVDRNPHVVTTREASRWVLFYIALAVTFGLGVWFFSGGQYAGEFFAGWITEYSLSIDNLFVFVIIMTTFAVPEEHQHKVLLIGILIALIMRAGFIAIGAAAIASFSWIFYVFGAFLIYTAYKLATHRNDEEEFKENAVLRGVKKVLPVTEDYRGAKLFIKENGKRFATPMLIVMIAIGTTDLLFALDSIPAIFGLTQEPFLVFTANAFALMGLRQLYFLIGGLLSKLIYLSIGLSVVLGFIGVKLIFEAMEGSGIEWVPHFNTFVSLGIIVGVLAVTTIASLLKVRRDPSAAKHLPQPKAETIRVGQVEPDSGRDSS